MSGMPERSTTAVRAAVPDGTALIEFVSGRGREPTTAFVVSREGVHAVRLPQADSLVEPIARLSRALESGLPGTGLARMLGGAILDPLLAPIRRRLPPMNGIDFSYMVLLFGLWILNWILQVLYMATMS